MSRKSLEFKLGMTGGSCNGGSVQSMHIAQVPGVTAIGPTREMPEKIFRLKARGFKKRLYRSR